MLEERPLGLGFSLLLKRTKRIAQTERERRLETGAKDQRRQQISVVYIIPESAEFFRDAKRDLNRICDCDAIQALPASQEAAVKGITLLSSRTNSSPISRPGSFTTFWI